MNFKINRLQFLENLLILKSLVDRNNILDVLSGVYLELIDDVLICKTTNLQSFMISKSYVTAYSNGKVMVDISLLVNLLTNIEDGNIHVIVDESNSIIIQTLSQKFKIKGYSALDFPEIEEPTNLIDFDIQCHDLLEGIRKTKFSISSNETSNLNNMLIKLELSSLIFISTDGHRLTKFLIEREYKDSKDNKDDLEIFIDQKSILKIEKFLISTNNCKVLLSRSHICFKSNNLEFCVKLQKYSFPKLVSLFGEFKHEFDIQVDNLISNLKLIKSIYSANNKIAIFKLSENILSIFYNSDDKIESCQKIECKYKGLDFSISLNIDYLLDLLNHMTICDFVKIRFNDRFSPIQITNHLNNHVGIICPCSV